jgi:predicted phage-related endonuclease
MMLEDSPWGAVAVLVMTRKFPVFIYDVPRHAGAEAKIRTKVREFWSAVEAGTQPPADFTRDGEAIAAMFPRETRPAIDLSGDNRIRELLERRTELAAEIKPREDERAAIDAEIKQKLGDAEGASLPGWRVTWKMRKGYVTEVKPGRVLRVTDMREKESMQ